MLKTVLFLWGEAMNEKSVSHQINRMMLHSTVWAVFALHIFYYETAWNQTFLGEFFLIPYSTLLVYTIAIGYFTVLNVNLYFSVLGKKNNLFGIKQVFSILIWVLPVLLVSQFVMINLARPFHLGLFGYYFESAGYVNIVFPIDAFAFVLYALSMALCSVYTAGIIVYFIQFSKMRIKIGFMGVVRYMVTLFLLALVMANTPSGFHLDALVFTAIYIGIGIVIYLRYKYSLRALVFAILVLFLL